MTSPSPAPCPGTPAERPATRRRLLAALALLVGLTASTPRSDAASADDTALIAAAERGDSAAVRSLLARGASVTARDNRGRTALLVATHGNHVEIARALIAAGSDVNARDAIDDSPYLYAGAEGRTEILRLTLAHGADPASVNRYGGTALIPAAHHGHVDAVRMLLGTRIDVNHVNRLGWTALLEAVILGDGGPVHTRIVEFLLAGGANPNLADRGGITPLAHARQRGYRAMAAAIEKAGGR